VEIKVYATLRDVVGGTTVQLQTGPEVTVDEILQQLFSKYPELQQKLLNGQGDMHSAFHILINGRDARYINGLETVVAGTDEVRIFPPVGGGR